MGQDDELKVATAALGQHGIRPNGEAFSVEDLAGQLQTRGWTVDPPDTDSGRYQLEARKVRTDPGIPDPSRRLVAADGSTLLAAYARLLLGAIGDDQMPL